MLPRMRRMVCLDGLRGALAFYVLLSHALPFAPMPHWLHWLFRHGGAAVDVFFILSGLVIVQSLTSYAYRPLPFLIARVARIYPVFLVVFAFSVALQPLSSGLDWMTWIGSDSTARTIRSDGWPTAWASFIVTHLTMTHGVFPNGVLRDAWLGFLGAAWSLSTEWQFYLLALLIGRRLGLVRTSWLFLVMAAVSTVWQVALPEPWQFSRAFLPNKAQYFAVGIASALVVRDARQSVRAYSAVLATTLLLCLVQGGIEKLLPPIVWTACLAAQMVASSGAQRGNRRWVAASAVRPTRLLAALLQSSPLVRLGALSYCIYLVNEPVQKLLGIALVALVGSDASLFTALWMPAAVALPILASWWLHKRIEAPALRAGRALARRAMSPPVMHQADPRRVKVQ